MVLYQKKHRHLKTVLKTQGEFQKITLITIYFDLFKVFANALELRFLLDNL